MQLRYTDTVFVYCILTQPTMQNLLGFPHPKGNNMMPWDFAEIHYFSILSIWYTQ